MTAPSRRPRSLAEVGRRAASASRVFDAATREFLDEWQSMTGAEKGDALIEEPVEIGRVPDAYLAALAEHLALADDVPIPAWTEAPSRFLSEPHFAGGLESLKALLIVQSPAAFRRRLIFISHDALSRPRRVISGERNSSELNLGL
ncbi:MAG: hypothetical protein ACT4N2_16320 [Hyphomicrobium sp.]